MVNAQISLHTMKSLNYGVHLYFKFTLILKISNLDGHMHMQQTKLPSLQSGTGKMCLINNSRLIIFNHTC